MILVKLLEAEMEKMQIIVAAALLLTITCTATPAQQIPEEALSLTISPQPTKYFEGEPIPVKLTFKNTDKKPTSFILPSKDSDPPGFIQARVWDEKGALLTLNDTVENGWWTVLVLSSSVYIEKESDRVSLEPDEDFTRVIDLRRILAGCRCLPDGLKAGAYRVQFSYGKVVSNEIKITVEN